MTQLTGLPRRLVESGLISSDQVESILKKMKEEKRSFTSIAVSSGAISAQSVASLASDEFGLPLLDISAFDSELMPQGLVSQSLIEKHRILPLFTRGNRLYVAQSDPSHILGIDEIKFNTGMSVEAILVEEDKLSIAVDRLISAADTSLEDAFDDLDSALDEVDLEDPDSRDKQNDADAGPGDDATIVRFVNKILLDAIRIGASD
ncbi:MAG: type IV-A pilus assembly ATPase PilB, partial [Thalassolituus sp.]